MHDDSFQQLQPGRLIAERYRLEEPIGQGAMGSVWRGVHVQLDAPVAIKLLKSAIAGDPEVLERFLREARSAAAVRSSHVVQIFDYGVDAGLPFIAMELLVGEPLDVRLDQRGVLSAPELDKVFSEVARAVAHAHAQGVVHRDIKPGNVFIALEGDREVTKVLDFGIAKLVDQRLDAPVGNGTHTGNILGTPSYMSPEQARGERQVDHRSDVWALAVLAMECLTARHPFESETLGDLVVKVCTAQPLLPSSVATVPAGFDDWFARGINKDPGGRFQSVLEMADALHVLLAAQGLAAESRPGSSRVRRIATEPAAGALTQPSFPHTMPTPVPGTNGPTSSEVLHLVEHTRATPMVAARSTPAAPPASRRGIGWAALLLGAVGLAVALVLAPGRGLLSRAAEPETRAASPTSGAAPSLEPAPAAAAPPAVTANDSLHEPAPTASVPAPAMPARAASPTAASPTAPTTAAQPLAEPAAAGLRSPHPSSPPPSSPPAATPAAKPHADKRAVKHGAKPRTPSRVKPRHPEPAAPVVDPYADRL